MRSPPAQWSSATCALTSSARHMAIMRSPPAQWSSATLWPHEKQSVGMRCAGIRAGCIPDNDLWVRPAGPVEAQIVPRLGAQGERHLLAGNGRQAHPDIVPAALIQAGAGIELPVEKQHVAAGAIGFDEKAHAIAHVGCPRGGIERQP